MKCMMENYILQFKTAGQNKNYHIYHLKNILKPHKNPTRFIMIDRQTDRQTENDREI